MNWPTLEAHCGLFSNVVSFRMKHERPIKAMKPTPAGKRLFTSRMQFSDQTIGV